MTDATGTTYFNIDSASNHLSTLSGASTQTNQWDANGNLIKLVDALGQTTSFSYDSRGRLAKSIPPAGWWATYGVNGLGQRISQTAADITGGTNKYFYDNDGNLLGIYDNTGARVQEISYIDSLPVALRVQSSGNTYYINTDQVGAWRSLGFNSGNYSWVWDHDPFGTTTPNQNPNGYGALVFNMRFPGQYRDSANGMFYNMGRDYNPKIGGYIEADLIGLAGAGAGSISLYPYAGSNPVTNADPSGNASLIGVGIGVLAGGTAGYVTGGWKGLIVGGVVGGAVGVIAPQVSAAAGGGAAGIAAFLGTSAGGAALGTVALNRIDNKPLLDDVGLSALIGGTVPLITFEAPVVGLGLLGEEGLAGSLFSINSGVLGISAASMDKFVNTNSCPISPR